MRLFKYLSVFSHSCLRIWVFPQTRKYNVCTLDPCQKLYHGLSVTNKISILLNDTLKWLFGKCVIHPSLYKLEELLPNQDLLSGNHVFRPDCFELFFFFAIS